MMNVVLANDIASMLLLCVFAVVSMVVISRLVWTAVVGHSYQN